MGKNTSKMQVKSYPSWLFPRTKYNASKYQVPQSHNLNPSTTKTCIFYRKDCWLGIYLSFTWAFLPQSDYNYGLRDGHNSRCPKNIYF